MRFLAAANRDEITGINQTPESRTRLSVGRIKALAHLSPVQNPGRPTFMSGCLRRPLSIGNLMLRLVLYYDRLVETHLRTGGDIHALAGIKKRGASAGARSASSISCT